jgi:hypothetical protein
MKKYLLLFLFLGILSSSKAQNQDLSSIGREIKLNLSDLTQRLQSANSSIDAQLPLINFPVNKNETMDFRMKVSPIIENQPADIKTYSGETLDKKGHIRLTITSARLTAIIHIDGGYYFIEPIDMKSGTYRIYNIAEAQQGSCDNNGQAFENHQPLKNGRVLSVAPFPSGTTMRTYRMAGAATAGMTTAFGSQAAARDKIIEIVNANNLIYQLEVSAQFTLISQTTTSMMLIFTTTSNPADPFTVAPNFANAGNAQTGYNTLNTNNNLLYNTYDVAHTFNSYVTGSGPTYFIRGQAGGTPCDDASKATGWTEFVSTAPLGSIVNLYAHELGHQFSAWHTYNAVGGSVSNPTFCTGGWDGQTAIEPGSGSTIMGYGNNCSSPTNYVLATPNQETYFHTKSLEQMLNKIANVSTCFTTTATGNTPPTATAGTAFTIPKGTPFSLTGSATDPNTTDVLTYVWDEYDVATANDKGAFGATITGTGGYTAVNSTASAPLFRSRMSSSTTRTFPRLADILSNANVPALNVGEALPQVSRTMKFRFTVRDNRANGGGVDSEERTVTVDATKGPLAVTAPNGSETMAAGSSQTITWSVNSTNALSANVQVLLSIDGGNTFPYTLSGSTANDGSFTVTIPANVVASTTCRIKIASLSNPTAEFFDISNGNFTITSTCTASTTSICPTAAVSGQAGNAVFNLGLNYVSTNKIAGNTKIYPVTTTPYPVINYIDNTFATCQESGWGTENAILVTFRVSQTGSYTISNTGDNSTGTAPFSIFSSTTYNCANFVGGNSYAAIGWSGSRTITLNECTTYYAVLYQIYNSGTANNHTFTVSGVGDLLEILTNPAGFSYTYAAVNQSTNQISAISSTSNFTSLGGGTYSVYGLQYANAVNPNTLLNQTISQSYNLGSCILFSSNSKTLNVTANPCPNTLTLVSTADDISTGNITKQASSTFNAAPSANIVATNKITGTASATYQAKSILLNAGFGASSGTIFRAEVGGCN